MAGCGLPPPPLKVGNMRLKLEQISFKYRSLFAKTTVIDNLSWKLDPGITGVLGPNGSGKTTLMRLIDRSLRESSGDITVDGAQVRTDSEVRHFRRQLGILPQNPSFVPWMTAAGTLEYLAWVYQIRRETLGHIVSSSLESVDLLAHASKPVRKLSGGQKQRLAFACATLGRPRLLLLDEPTAGLDPTARLIIRELIHKQGEHATVLLSTHLLEDVAHLCPRVGILKDGQIAYSGSFSALEKTIEPVEGSTGSAFEQAYGRIIADAGRRD